MFFNWIFDAILLLLPFYSWFSSTTIYVDMEDLLFFSVRSECRGAKTSFKRGSECLPYQALFKHVSQSVRTYVPRSSFKVSVREFIPLNDSKWHWQATKQLTDLLGNLSQEASDVDDGPDDRDSDNDWSRVSQKRMVQANQLDLFLPLYLSETLP